MCGIAAVIDLEGRANVVPIARDILSGLQRRGTLGAGIAWHNIEGGIQTVRGNGLVLDVLSDKAIRHAHGSSAIAHDRYATDKHTDECKVQPYLYAQPDTDHPFAFGFNGNIANTGELTDMLVASGYPPSMEGDTEIIGRLILRGMQRHTHKNLEDIMRDLHVLDGSFNIVHLGDDGSVTALREKSGIRPLCYAQKDSLVAIASEDNAIHNVWKHTRIHDIQPGDMFRAQPHFPATAMNTIWQAEPRHCFFEQVYFASHESHLDGISVHNTRQACGKILGKMDRDRPKDDIVVPVPVSARIAAGGYRDERNISMVECVRTHEDKGRTFIEPGNRDKKAEEKYWIDTDLVIKDRPIILIDDSLVRGTTMKVLVRKLREGGAVEIHLRLASPPILRPCFYGIDFPTVSELLARKFNGGTLIDGVLPPHILEDMARELGVDSLAYVPQHMIPDALDTPEKHLCMACVTGDYPTPAGKRNAEQAEKLYQLSGE